MLSKAVKVGDKVIVRIYNVGLTEKVGTVTKVLKNFVDVEYSNGVHRFRLNGTQPGKHGIYGGFSELDDYEEERAQDIIRYNTKFAMSDYLRYTKFYNWSYENLERVYNLVKEIEAEGK